MLSILIAVRNALLALALGWVGVTLERVAAETGEPTSIARACSTDGGMCSSEKPGFNALDCRER
ncbi:MAG: hypothetical protein WDM79_07855 [Terricaulis sp.]